MSSFNERQDGGTKRLNQMKEMSVNESRDASFVRSSLPVLEFTHTHTHIYWMMSVMVTGGIFSV